MPNETCDCGATCQDIGGGRCRYHLANLPIVQAADGGKRFADGARQGVQEEGAAARGAGWPISRCPRFVDPDMTVDWQIGWRHEDECKAGKRDRKTGLLK